MLGVAAGEKRSFAGNVGKKQVRNGGIDSDSHFKSVHSFTSRGTYKFRRCWLNLSGCWFIEIRHASTPTRDCITQFYNEYFYFVLQTYKHACANDPSLSSSNRWSTSFTRMPLMIFINHSYLYLPLFRQQWGNAWRPKVHLLFKSNIFVGSPSPWLTSQWDRLYLQFMKKRSLYVQA